MVAIGVTFIIIMGSIDLSMEGTVSVSAVIFLVVGTVSGQIEFGVHNLAWPLVMVVHAVMSLGVGLTLATLQVLIRDTSHLYAIGAQMADRLTHATKKLHDLAFVDAKGRITNALYDLCKEPDAMTHPDGMQIKVSRQELGRIVGCSREVAGRILKVLEQEGLVQVSGHTMVVHGTR